MRIIGGKDYYDHAVYYNTDTTRIFKRQRFDVNNTKEDKVLSDIGWLEFADKEHINEKRETFVLRTQYVIIAGKVFCGVRISYRKNFSTPEIVEYFWNKGKLLHYFNTNGIVLRKTSWKDEYVALDNLDYLFTPYNLKGDNLDYMIKNEIIIAISYSEFYWNRRTHIRNWMVNSEGLDKIGFPSVMKPTTAYQEIDMFIGSILVNDADHMVKVSDKTKIAKYGFDDFSFKNKIHQSKPRGN